MTNGLISYIIIVVVAIGIAGAMLNEPTQGEHFTFRKLLESFGLYRSEVQKTVIVKNIREGVELTMQYYQDLQDHQRLVSDQIRNKNSRLMEDLRTKLDQIEELSQSNGQTSLGMDSKKSLANNIKTQSEKIMDDLLQKLEQNQLAQFAKSDPQSMRGDQAVLIAEAKSRSSKLMDDLQDRITQNDARSREIWSSGLLERQRAIIADTRAGSELLMDDLRFQLESFQAHNRDELDPGRIRDQQREIAQKVEDQRIKAKENSDLQRERQRQLQEQTDAQQAKIREVMQDQKLK